MQAFKILAADPGQTTGIVVATFTIPIMRLTMISFRDVYWGENDEALKAYLNQSQLFSVIERSPTRNNYNAEIFFRTLHALNGSSKVTVYSPGDWKPMAKSKKWKAPVAGMSQHTKDAANLLLYFCVRNWDYMGYWSH